MEVFSYGMIFDTSRVRYNGWDYRCWVEMYNNITLIRSLNGVDLFMWEWSNNNALLF